MSFRDLIGDTTIHDVIHVNTVFDVVDSISDEDPVYTFGYTAPNEEFYTAPDGEIYTAPY